MEWSLRNFIRRHIPHLLQRAEYSTSLFVLALLDRRVSWTARIMALTGVAYVFSNFDLIPNSIPVFGYADEVTALGVSVYLTRLIIPSDILAQHLAFVDVLSCKGTQFFSPVAALKGLPAHTAFPRLNPIIQPLKQEYNVLFIVATSLATLAGFELLLRAITHTYPNVYHYGSQARWGIGLTVAFLTAFELLLRSVGSNHPKINRLDPLIGWRPRAGIRGMYDREGDGVVDISINSAGYRDREHTLTKPMGTFRIAVLGDSMTEAREVPLEQTFWKRLEKMIPVGPFKEKKLEVLNFSVHGYGTAQSLLTLQEHALQYSPDLVLLAFFTGSNVTENSWELGRHNDRPYFEIIKDALTLVYKPGDASHFARRMHREEIRLRLLDDFRIYQFIRERRIGLRSILRYVRQPIHSRKASPDENLGIYQSPKDDRWTKAWQVTEELITAIDKTARENGAEFMLVTLSNPLQVTPDAALHRETCKNLGVEDLTYPDRRLASFAHAHNIPCVTLIDRLAKFAAEHRVQPHLYTPEQPGVHYRAIAHEVIAKEIAQAIERIEVAAAA